MRHNFLLSVVLTATLGAGLFGMVIIWPSLILIFTFILATGLSAASVILAYFEQYNGQVESLLASLTAVNFAIGILYSPGNETTFKTICLITQVIACTV
jgi:hypothetical protein